MRRLSRDTFYTKFDDPATATNFYYRDDRGRTWMAKIGVGTMTLAEIQELPAGAKPVNERMMNASAANFCAKIRAEIRSKD